VVEMLHRKVEIENQQFKRKYYSETIKQGLNDPALLFGN
jgi:hypothetical protein